MAYLSGRDKKRRFFGQHFLRDESICQLIAQTAVDESLQAGCTTLLEIGPGEGAITQPLLAALANQKQIQQLVIGERDRELIDFWESKKTESGFPYELAPGDFVTLGAEHWLKGQPLGVVSNLPYSAGTAIVIKLAHYTQEIPVMVLMFQAEVARRLRATPNTKEWGSLSVWIQNHWDVTRLVGVPPRAFFPPPKVDSEVVILRRRPQPRIEVHNEKLWDSLLRVAFAHRRKMLRSGLPPSGPWRAALLKAGIDGTKRAESLTWEDWGSFYRATVEISSPETSA